MSVENGCIDQFLVSLSVPLDNALEKLMVSVESRIRKALPAFRFQRLPISDVHISLSRTVTLRFGQIDSFVTILQQNLLQSGVNG